MKHQHLNLTGMAWRQLRRNWDLAPAAGLLWQTLVPGSLFTALNGIQRRVAREQLTKAGRAKAVAVVGYWRSGTTLLHELLCLDRNYSFPTTHACMNPQHFLLTEQAALARETPGVQRPMDEMEVRPGSPQEDEFALLSLGARSPYEALLAPDRLREALRLADPRDLAAGEEEIWRSIFLEFFSGVSARGGGRPVILKSPTHGFRLRTLRQLLPDARFVLIVRNPLTNFESTVRMWRRMFELYAIAGKLPSDDEIRQAVLENRTRFEEKLAEGAEGLAANRFATVKYESLIADPPGEMERLYERLELGEFGPVRPAIQAEMAERAAYRAEGRLPADAWRDRLKSEWAEVFSRYGYRPNVPY